MGKTGKKKTAIYMLIDALGWKAAESCAFMRSRLACRQEVETRLGDLHAAAAAISSGQPPARHGRFSFFYYSPETSPFAAFKYMKFAFGAGLYPKCLTNRKWFRKRISKAAVKFSGDPDGFKIFSMPYHRLPFFDYCEKSDPFAENGLAPLENLGGILKKSGLKFFLSAARKSDGQNLRGALESARAGADFEFVHNRGFADFLTENISGESAAAAALKELESQAESLIGAVEEAGRECEFTVISTCGAQKCEKSADLAKAVNSLGLKFGRDYAAVFEPSMARFWYFSERAKAAIRAALSAPNAPGEFLRAENLAEFGADFPDKKFGDDIYMCRAGVRIFPSDMQADSRAETPCLNPNSKDSRACFLSNKIPPFAPRKIDDFFALMKADIERLKKQSGSCE
ncbi:MAG: hypothetical protein DBX55_09350 [Verrucomicrobia bacterium]|nr:MAG: hypothetical protein DBX55_09350 [Verrucomicrobiota bacterium]